jgi:hypothetical protein
VTLVTLLPVTDAATMQKIPFWRYVAVNRKTLFTAFACALLIFSLLGCGETNKLQNIQLSSSNTTESVAGTISIGINGPVDGPVQLYLWGNYSNGKSKLLNGTDIVYSISINADNPYAVNPGTGEEYALEAPPNTITLSSTGLLTATEPSACTWFNSAVSPATSPAWSMVGSYVVTATYQGLTSQPFYVAMASAPGVYNSDTNPTGECGPQSSGS